MKKPRRLKASDIAHTTDVPQQFRQSLQKAEAKRRAALAREVDSDRGDPAMDDGVTIERIERALALLAYLIERDGPVYAPIFERLERELASLHARDDTVARAKRLLESYGGRPPFGAIAPPLALPSPSE